MGMIQNIRRMGIQARLVVTVTVSVLLALHISVHDLHANFCFENWGCCSEDSDCPEGDTCEMKAGLCAHIYPYYLACSSDSHCLFGMWCAFPGVCAGGENDGEHCFTNLGACALSPVDPCRTDDDCAAGPCVLFDCDGGTCEPCGGTGCYIATAAFGTELEDKTDVLRSFRDEYLLNNAVGKAFVTAYYKYGPPLADYIAERDWLRSLVRILLLPVIGLISLLV